MTNPTEGQSSKHDRYQWKVAARPRRRHLRLRASPSVPSLRLRRSASASARSDSSCALRAAWRPPAIRRSEPLGVSRLDNGVRRVPPAASSRLWLLVASTRRRVRRDLEEVRRLVADDLGLELDPLAVVHEDVAVAGALAGRRLNGSDSTSAPIHSQAPAASTTCGKTRSGGAAISIVCSFRCRATSSSGALGPAHLLGRGLALLVDAPAHGLELVRRRRAGRRRRRGLRLGLRRWRSASVPAARDGVSAPRRRDVARRRFCRLRPRRASRGARAGERPARAGSEPRGSRPPTQTDARPLRRCSAPTPNAAFGSQTSLSHDEEAQGKSARSLYSDDFLPRPAPPLPERREQARPLQTEGRRNREL